MTSRTAILGGTGLTHPEHFEIERRDGVETPFGKPSADLLYGTLFGQSVVFLARHGNPHVIPPHRINYRANLWALKEAGVERVLAIAAVGGITQAMGPSVIAIPEQLIDYTYGRDHTYFEEDLDHVTHIDFTEPYTPALRQSLIDAAERGGIAIVDRGVYGCTQGPRLETPAEILKMERDGCDLVGMTGMPEASLAREIELDYAVCAVVANWAAGKQPGAITMAEIEDNLKLGMAHLGQLLQHWQPGT
ncbi:MAG: S-methyl-5'-thioinosine phosphorylase [Methylococcus sp.]|jgi:5'-methylthioadenosine phosphorylase/5'-methylthioinosine phosphorylase|nr:MAG: S-methyl-5'-thioinosine phosphorylase [Methylococcus sp.]